MGTNRTEGKLFLQLELLADSRWNLLVNVFQHLDGESKFCFRYDTLLWGGHYKMILEDPIACSRINEDGKQEQLPSFSDLKSI